MKPLFDHEKMDLPEEEGEFRIDHKQEHESK